MTDTPEEQPPFKPPPLPPEGDEPSATNGTGVDSKLIDGLMNPPTHGFCTMCGDEMPAGSTTLVCATCVKLTTQPVAPPGSVKSNVRCYKCGYELVGIAAKSVCPECGYACAVSVEVAQRLPPSQGLLAIGFLWPLGILIPLLLGNFLGSRADSYFFGFGAAAMVVVNILNHMILSSILAKKYIPAAQRRSTSKNMFALGVLTGTGYTIAKVASILIVIAVVLGILAISLVLGACLSVLNKH